jgi:hypothetical protein
MIRDPKTGAEKVWKGNGKPPKEWTEEAQKLVQE